MSTLLLRIWRTLSPQRGVPRTLTVGVLSLMLVILGASCGGTPSSTSGAANRSSSESSPNSSAITKVETANIPVARCVTTFALATQPSIMPLPASITARVPNALATRLVSYGDTSGLMMLLAPKGWSCTAAYGADGSGGLMIRPRGESVPLKSWGAGWSLPHWSQDEAITGIETGGSPVQAAGQSCAYFKAASAAIETALGHGCPSRPVSERVRQISSSIVGFEDPSGVNGRGIPSGGRDPANGIITYSSGVSPGSYLATCTLPAVQHSLCSAVLNEFSELYGKR